MTKHLCIIVFVLLLILIVLGRPTQAKPPSDATSKNDWVLTFDDEFASPKLDSSKWTPTYGVDSNRSHPLQFNLPQSLTVSDGHLKILASHQKLGTYDYTSGEIKSIGKFAQRYGYFEVRCRFPKAHGAWSAVYLLPESNTWPPEIDITEFIGRKPHDIVLTNHWGQDESSHRQSNANYKDPTQDWGDWHTYAVDWEPGLVRWFIDDVERGEADGGVSDVPMYVRLNCAVGGRFAGQPSLRHWPQKFAIDYVRVYRHRDQAPTPKPDPKDAFLVAPGMITSPYPIPTPYVPPAMVPPTTHWLEGHFILMGLLTLGLSVFLFPRIQDKEHRSWMRAVATASVIVTIMDYLGWRVSVINWSAAWIGLPLFAAEFFGIVQILGWHYTTWPRPSPRLIPTNDNSNFPVTILIPTVNEGVSIVRQTLLGAIGAADQYRTQFPNAKVTIVLCNDGYVAGYADWERLEELASELRVLCITRKTGGGAKAGNLEYCRQQIGAVGQHLIAVFDADMIPSPDFLVQMVAPFRDAKVGWVQSGQFYRNLHQPIAQWAQDQQQLFFGMICPSKARVNAGFLCGTNFVIRAESLDEIGGLPQDSVTEDFAASLLLHDRWQGVYVEQKLATGLGPGDLAGYFSQQRRWAFGTLQATRRYWSLLVGAKSNLTRPQRIQYLLSGTHYLHGVATAIFVAAPLIYLFGGSAAIAGANAGWFAAHFLPYWILSQWAFWIIGDRRTHWRGAILGFAAFPTLAGAAVAVALGRQTAFVVTPKHRRRHNTWRVLGGHIVLLCLCLLALAMPSSHVQNQGLVILSRFWVAVSASMLAAILILAYRDGKTAMEPLFLSPGRKRVARNEPGEGIS